MVAVVFGEEESPSRGVMVVEEESMGVDFFFAAPTTATIESEVGPRHARLADVAAGHSKRRTSISQCQRRWVSRPQRCLSEEVEEKKSRGGGDSRDSSSSSIGAGACMCMCLGGSVEVNVNGGSAGQEAGLKPPQAGPEGCWIHQLTRLKHAPLHLPPSHLQTSSRQQNVTPPAAHRR